MFRVRKYIQNANLIQKVFLFTGVIAFAYWLVEVELLWAFENFPNDIDYLWDGDDLQNALWLIFISIVGSYVFQSKKGL